jgi:hypothetical protein
MKKTPEMMPQSEKDLECKNHDGNIIVRVSVKEAYSIGSPKYEEAIAEMIKVHNENKFRGTPTGTFKFPTSQHAHLWIEEFTGQMSDGKYENTSNTQWRWFSDLQIVVDYTIKYPVIEGTIPNHVRMSFVDLIWLYDGKEGYSRKYTENEDYEKWPLDRADVRNVFSNVSTEYIKMLSREIQAAMNNEPIVEEKSDECSPEQIWRDGLKVDDMFVVDMGRYGAVNYQVHKITAITRTQIVTSCGTRFWRKNGKIVGWDDKWFNPTMEVLTPAIRETIIRKKYVQTLKTINWESKGTGVLESIVKIMEAK